MEYMKNVNKILIEDLKKSGGPRCKWGKKYWRNSMWTEFNWL